MVAIFYNVLQFPDYIVLQFPDNVLQFPDNVLQFPDNVLQFPDNVLQFPDNVLQSGIFCAELHSSGNAKTSAYWNQSGCLKSWSSWEDNPLHHRSIVT